MEIIEIWFANYKGEKIEIIRSSKKKKTFKFIKDANKYYLENLLPQNLDKACPGFLPVAFDN